MVVLMVLTWKQHKSESAAKQWRLRVAYGSHGSE
jgi:hypothetical protein